jgi:LytS/YehU family sensor histidine kinase
LIDENTKNAKKFVKNLSTIYRYILEHKQADLVLLDSEMDFATKYLELLKFRFEDSLNFSINVNSNSKQIIPLASQILLENTIKHNIITDINPLKINIYTEDDFLIVENNYNPLNSDFKSTKHGLKNINERCKYLLNKEIKVIKTDEKFIVKVPLK